MKAGLIFILIIFSSFAYADGDADSTVIANLRLEVQRLEIELAQCQGIAKDWELKYRRVEVDLLVNGQQKLLQDKLELQQSMTIMSKQVTNVLRDETLNGAVLKIVETLPKNNYVRLLMDSIKGTKDVAKNDKSNN